jgi:hypothetical protein
MEEAEESQTHKLEDLLILEERINSLEKQLGIEDTNSPDLPTSVTTLDESIKHLLEFNENIDK